MIQKALDKGASLASFESNIIINDAEPIFMGSLFYLPCKIFIMLEKKILLTDCPDDKGLIAKITNICYKHQLNILHNNEFVDFETKHFFMRTELEGILMKNSVGWFRL